MPWVVGIWLWWQGASNAAPTVPLTPGMEIVGLLWSVVGWMMWRHDAALNRVTQGLDRSTRAVTVALVMYHHAEAELAEAQREIKALQEELALVRSMNASKS